VGWDEAINFEAARLSLSRSLHAVIAIATAGHPEDEQAVGMGRIVGDGAIYFYIQDIAVRPEWQGTGIGRAVVEELMEWLHEHAPPRAFVGLFAAGGREGFYAHYGFLRHPSLTGMFTVMPALQLVEQGE
jgi:GNAT superfamily N-acetyltransferase